MDYTALHRHLGRRSGPVDDELLNAAVDANLRETDDLDWKLKLPSMKVLGKTDFPKDVAAFANAGGGTIVYGVEEDDMAAEKRVDIGDCTEADVRTMISVAASHIHPPVLGLRVHRLAASSKHAVVVVVPPSLDQPHLILCDHQRFGAPLRNGADTRWMSEREIAERYRQRFAEQRIANDVLDQLYDDATAWPGPRDRAWGIAVARPRIPLPSGLSRDDARRLIYDGRATAARMLRKAYDTPLDAVDANSLRHGLRRWTARPKGSTNAPYHQARANLHHDGSVTLAAALGGHPDKIQNELPGSHFESWRLEVLVADFMNLLKAVGDHMGGFEFDVRLGIDWDQGEALLIEALDFAGYRNEGVSQPLNRYAPVDATVTLQTDAEGFLQQTREFATDCINQGGVPELVAMKTTMEERAGSVIRGISDR
ncbi:ATP-binding protein [Glycomyces sp. NPDC049804]|uniref:AlbA family DNA-binding domain-containing protein n=1 Tax=Glycomyces sp. NPDC049804 TaxID=3154363 RepID=UPI003418B8C9